MRIFTASACVAAFLLAGAASAQSDQAQQNENQQQKIQEGLKSGELTTKEAGKLEREESRVQRDQARAMRNGKMSKREKERIQREQSRVSSDISRQSHDAQTGNPESASAKRMESNVQRNIDQQKRIEQGVDSGQLTTREAGKLERGQSRVEGHEARAAANGKVGAVEERSIQRSDNRQSRNIERKKHNRRENPDAAEQQQQPSQ